MSDNSRSLLDFLIICRYSSYFIRSTTLPAYNNAPLAVPQAKSARWPVLVFSHGLGGSRNTYSQICGSMASHGVIVAAPEHRDGSGPISFATGKDGKQTTIPFRRVSYQPSPETYAARREQLCIRLWELGALYSLLTSLESGQSVSPLDDSGEVSTIVSSFKAKIDASRPGAVTWAGHSFGAATVVQFLKSVYYNVPSPAPQGSTALFSPSRTSSIVRQVLPASPVILLDLWSFPLRDPSTFWFSKQPLPSYRGAEPSGDRILVIISEAFFKWKQNLVATKEAVSPAVRGIKGVPPAHLFYAEQSAHLSQSDFGVLFPWVTRLLLKTQDPERILRLNTRAITEVMRRAGSEVARTTDVDMEITGARKGTKENVDEKPDTKGFSDKDILSREGKVRGWIALDLEAETHIGEGADKQADESAKPVDRDLDVAS